MREHEFSARDKKVQKITGDGLAEINQTTGVERNISGRTADVSFYSHKNENKPHGKICQRPRATEKKNSWSHHNRGSSIQKALQENRNAANMVIGNLCLSNSNTLDIEKGNAAEHNVRIISSHGRSSDTIRSNHKKQHSKYNKNTREDRANSKRGGTDITNSNTNWIAVDRNVIGTISEEKSKKTRNQKLKGKAEYKASVIERKLEQA